MKKLSLVVTLCCTSTLANEYIELEDIVVTASGYEQNIIEAPATITNIEKEQIQNRAVQDIKDVLDDIAGVSIEGGGGKLNNSSINIRGLGEEYVLFLIDGKPQGQAGQVSHSGFTDQPNTSFLPPASAIERVEVIKGPMSSLYGSEAMGGVINVITKKVPDKATGQLTYDTMLHENSDSRGYNQLKYYLASPILDNVLGVSFYGTMFHKPEDHIFGGNKRRTKGDNRIKLNYKINNHQDIELLMGYGTTKSKSTRGKSVDTRTTSDALLEVSKRSYGLIYNLDYENFKSTNFITHENTHLNLDNMTSAYKQTIINTKNVIPFDIAYVTIGAEYKQEETKHFTSRYHGANNAADLKRWQAALFAESEFFITDSFFLTTGLRVDENEHYGTEIIPRIYAVYKITDEITLKGGVSKGYKAPELKQSDPAIGEQSGGPSRKWGGGGVDIGNFDLKPETSINYEISLAYNDNAISTDATIFFTDFEDKIGKDYICGPTFKTGRKKPKGFDPDNFVCEYYGNKHNYINQYINTDKAQIKGLELNFKYKILDNTTLKANYTYQKSEYKSGKNKGQPFFQTPEHMANLGVDYRFNDDLMFWGKVKYKSETQERTSKNGSSSIPSYTMVDIGARYSIGENFDVFAGVYNLFDKKINNEEGYGKYLDGRRYNLGFNVKF